LKTAGKGGEEPIPPVENGGKKMKLFGKKDTEKSNIGWSRSTARNLSGQTEVLGFALRAHSSYN